MLQLVDGFIAHHFMFGVDSALPGMGREAPAEMVAVVNAQGDALNAHDGAAHAATFTPEGELRIYDGTWANAEEHLSPASIAEWTDRLAEIAFHPTRTGEVLSQGPFAWYPWTLTTALGDAHGIAVLQLDDRNRVVQAWTVANDD